MSARIGLIGARGHAGGQIARLIGARADMTLTYAASRALAGAPFSALDAGARDPGTITAPDPEAAAAAGLDAAVLALPNGLAAPYVEAFDRAGADVVLVDLSSDHRDHADWVYGLPELPGGPGRAAIAASTRIANPGCYATAAQLVLAPLRDVLAGAPSAFGLSGYSGAGTTPGPRNDPARLHDTAVPYALIGHGHEAEISRGVGRPVAFSPHVAGFFRGLVVTVHAPLAEPLNAGDLRARYEAAYAGEALVTVQDEPPDPRSLVGRPGAVIGGLGVAPDPAYAAGVCALDNLLKGAASQAVQNLALALGLPEGPFADPRDAAA